MKLQHHKHRSVDMLAVLLITILVVAPLLALTAHLLTGR